MLASLFPTEQECIEHKQ